MTNSLHVANALNELESEPTLLIWPAALGIYIPDSFQGKVAESVLRAYDLTNYLLGLMVSTSTEHSHVQRTGWLK